MQRYTTAIRKIDHPVHNGQPNPVHGKYHFVGSVPAACCEAEAPNRSFKYDTEEDAVQAAIAGGAERIQRIGGAFVEGYE